MAKFVILALIATQLLTGSGGSIYLCIGADGSLDIHSGLKACTSCKVAEKADHHCCGEHARTHHDSSCVDHGTQCPTHVAAKAAVTADRCDCVHIPVVVASDQPSRVARTSVILNEHRIFSLASLPGHGGCDRQSVSRSMPYGIDKSEIANCSLAMVSMVVIRC